MDIISWAPKRIAHKFMNLFKNKTTRYLYEDSLEFSMKLGVVKRGDNEYYLFHFVLNQGESEGGREQWTQVNKWRTDIEVKDRGHMAPSS